MNSPKTLLHPQQLKHHRAIAPEFANGAITMSIMNSQRVARATAHQLRRPEPITPLLHRLVVQRFANHLLGRQRKPFAQAQHLNRQRLALHNSASPQHRPTNPLESEPPKPPKHMTLPLSPHTPRCAHESMPMEWGRQRSAQKVEREFDERAISARAPGSFQTGDPTTMAREMKHEPTTCPRL